MDADFQWSKVVLGGTIEALTFALENDCHVLISSYPNIHSYEKTNNPKYETLEQEWAAKSHRLYTLSRQPFVNLIQSLRVDEDNKLITVFTNTNNTYKAQYDELFVYDVMNVSGLEHKYDTKLKGYRVLDWFDATKVGATDLEEITTEDNFVNKITFFNNTRIDGDRGYKDLVSESFLTQEQLKNFDYSDTMAKFKTLNVLSNNGLDGANLTLWKRDVYPVYEGIS